MTVTAPPSRRPSPYVGEPLPSADDGEWIWVDFHEAKCRDGSGAGIGVRYGSGPGLVIFFEGGGACFNAFTCGVNQANFDGANFQGGNSGIFDPNSIENPVADWSFIYVPYCTGDVHVAWPSTTPSPKSAAHSSSSATLNVGHFHQRVVPAFLGEVDQVLTTLAWAAFGEGLGARLQLRPASPAHTPRSPSTCSTTPARRCPTCTWRPAWRREVARGLEPRRIDPVTRAASRPTAADRQPRRRTSARPQQRLGLVSSLGRTRSTCSSASATTTAPP